MPFTTHAQPPERLDVPPPATPAIASDAGTPPELDPPINLEILQARRLADAGQHNDAAQIYERQFGEVGDPRLLYHAGLLRALAGQHGHALRHFRQFLSLAGTLSDAAKQEINARIAASVARLATVRFAIREEVGGVHQPVAAATNPGARITVSNNADPPVVADPNQPLQLDPGPWMVRIEVPGYLPRTVQQLAEAGPAERTWEILLTRKTVSLELRFAPPRALRRVHLRLTATDRSAVTPIDRTLEGPTTTVMLTTGAWQLTASSPRHSADVALVVGDPPTPVDVVLQPRPAAQDPRFTKNRKVLIGFAGSLGVTYFTGIGLILVGINIDSRTDKKNADLLAEQGVEPDQTPSPAALAAVDAAYPTTDYHRSLRRSSDLQTAGATIAMAGIGAIFSMFPELLQARRRAAYVTLGVGAATLAGGATWMHFFLARQHALLDPTDAAHRASKTDFGHLTGFRLGAAMLTGLGIGLVGGSAAILLADRARLRRKSTALRVDPLAAPGHVGLLVRGAF